MAFQTVKQRYWESMVIQAVSMHIFKAVSYPLETLVTNKVTTTSSDMISRIIGKQTISTRGIADQRARYTKNHMRSNLSEIHQERISATLE